MALGYLPVDRDQQFLLPPDMREWLPEGHLAWFVLDVVDRVDTSVLHARHPNDGAGRRAYDPDMLLALLVYAYCSGERSSRRIEQLCEVDVAFRVIAAGHRPDHTTVARFRQGHEEIAAQLFTDVLMLCAAAGLVKVGVVAVDGTKVAADAAMKANRSRESIEAEVRAMFAEASVVDDREDTVFGAGRGDELPAELADPTSRRARLDAALRVLDDKRSRREARVSSHDDDDGDGDGEGEGGRRGPGRPRVGAEIAAAEAALAREEAAVAERVERWERKQREAAAQGRKVKGRRPEVEHFRVRDARQRLERARERVAARERRYGQRRDGRADQANVTDPDSRLMNGPRGWVQGYNAQAAATEDGIVLAAVATRDHNDTQQCTPMMTATAANLTAAKVTDDVGVFVFDAGYLTVTNLTAEGPDRLIATGKSKSLRNEEPTSGPPPDEADPIDAMHHRLRTPEGSAIYAKRQHIIEPVFGDAKHLRRFRRFSRRTLAAVDAEWKLVMAAHNIMKMHRQIGFATP
jgi:transposase